MSGSEIVKSVISVRFVPVRTRTPAALPFAIAASGGSSSTVASTTGWNGSTPTPSSRNAGMARNTASVDAARSASVSPARMPRPLTMRSAIAAERGDAVADPFERRDLVEDSGVAGTGEVPVEEIGEVEEPEGTEAVVDRHDDHVAVDRELGAVVPGRVARAPDERAAVDPH